MTAQPSFGAGRGLANRAPVSRTSHDYKRVLALPCRDDSSYPDRLVERMTEVCATPAGLARGVSLRDVQAKALYDLGKHKRGFFPMRVGSGKTLVTFLGPRLVGAQRPMLVLPASLIKKTNNEWRKAATDWQVSRQLQFMSYELLGRVTGADKLDRVKPDMLLLDEGHRAKNLRAAVTRRLKRYIEQARREGRTVTVVVLSGTIMKRSIKDFAHLLEWSHGPEATPLPTYAATLLEWAEALDEGVNLFQRRDPGALLDLMPGAYDDNGSDGDDNNARARRVFQKRLAATPGIVISDTKEDFTGSLVISALEYTPNEHTEANFKTLRETMCRPDGWALAEAMHVWAVARQLALGLHYAWDPLPPQEWLDARSQWAKFVRDYLASPEASKMGVDSELQVANAILRGEVDDDYGVLEHWQKQKPTFTVNPKDVWHDDSALNACVAWIKSHPRGIVWTEHQFFARTLSRLADVPYYGAKGLDSRGNFIEAHGDADEGNPYKPGPVIASIAANCTGRNLQFKWSDNLVTAPPADSERWEQLIARTHRPGQTEDTVTVDVLVGCREHLESIPRALTSSDVKTDLLGFSQKLRVADLVWPELKDPSRKGPRWA